MLRLFVCLSRHRARLLVLHNCTDSTFRIALSETPQTRIVYVCVCVYLFVCGCMRVCVKAHSLHHQTSCTYVCVCLHAFFDGYCSTVQGLLDWFEVDFGFTELSFIQIDLCVLCVFVLYSRVSLSSCPFWTFCTASPARWECL